MTDITARNWFERNSKKTIVITILLVFIMVDLLIGFLFLKRIPGNFHPYYHHGYKKNMALRADWGIGEYMVYTNSLDMRDRYQREVPLTTNKYRILFIGDSVTEGVGFPYEKTFVGLVEQQKNKTQVEVLNAGVMSYSPKLYYLRLKYLLEEEKLHINEVFVFIDISDIQDEILYEQFVPSFQISFLRKIDFYLRDTSFFYYHIRMQILNHRTIANMLKILHRTKSFQSKDVEQKNDAQLNLGTFSKAYYEERAKWTYDQNIFLAWGQKGVRLAENNMDKLVDLCKINKIKLNIAIYPWPVQIRNREINSRQVTIWKDFAEHHGIRFINYFPCFINATDPEEIIAHYFIKGDVHFNEKGHALIAQELITQINNEVIEIGSSPSLVGISIK